MENLKKEIRHNEKIQKALEALNNEFHYNLFQRFTFDYDNLTKEISGVESEYIAYSGEKDIDIKNNLDMMFFAEKMHSKVTITYDYKTNDVMFEQVFSYNHADKGRNGYGVKIIYKAATDEIVRYS